MTWLVNQKGIDVVIPGAKRPEQVKETAKASDIELSERELQKISDILNK